MVVLAHKWDAFEAEYGEAEYRKLLTRTLRYYAHANGASLVCTKQKDKQVRRRRVSLANAPGSSHSQPRVARFCARRLCDWRRCHPIVVQMPRARPQMLGVMRNMLYHHVFDTGAVKSVQLEHTKPLVVPASSDSFAGIGPPPKVSSRHRACTSPLSRRLPLPSPPFSLHSRPSTQFSHPRAPRASIQPPARAPRAGGGRHFGRSRRVLEGGL